MPLLSFDQFRPDPIKLNIAMSIFLVAQKLGEISASFKEHLQYHTLNDIDS